MAINIGENIAVDLFWGADQVKAAYLGAKRVHQAPVYKSDTSSGRTVPTVTYVKDDVIDFDTKLRVKGVYAINPNYPNPLSSVSFYIKVTVTDSEGSETTQKSETMYVYNRTQSGGTSGSQQGGTIPGDTKPEAQIETDFSIEAPDAVSVLVELKSSLDSSMDVGGYLGAVSAELHCTIFS